jgi:SRSO17 transposase
MSSLPKHCRIGSAPSTRSSIAPGSTCPRVELREQAKGYLQALLSPIERKNGWQMAECLGHQTPYKIQHLLGRSHWDAELLRDEVRNYVVEHLGEHDGVLIIG